MGLYVNTRNYTYSRTFNEQQLDVTTNKTTITTMQNVIYQKITVNSFSVRCTNFYVSYSCNIYFYIQSDNSTKENIATVITRTKPTSSNPYSGTLSISGTTSDTLSLNAFETDNYSPNIYFYIETNVSGRYYITGTVNITANITYEAIYITNIT